MDTTTKASQIRAAAAVDPAATEQALAAKGEREEAAAERVAAWEAEHGKLRPIRRGRR